MNWILISARNIWNQQEIVKELLKNLQNVFGFIVGKAFMLHGWREITVSVAGRENILNGGGSIFPGKIKQQKY